MDKKETKTTHPKTQHITSRKKVFDVMRPGRTAASPTSRPVLAGRQPAVKDSVLKQDISVRVNVATAPAIQGHSSAPVVQPATTAPVLGSLRVTHPPQLRSLQSPKSAPAKDPNARSQLATAVAPAIIPRAPGSAPDPRFHGDDNADGPHPEHREEDMEGLERLALDQVIKIDDPEVRAAIDDIQPSDLPSADLSILESPDLADAAALEPSPTSDAPDQPPVARPEPLLFEPLYKKRERQGHRVFKAFMIILLVLALAALVLNFLLDAGSVSLPFELPHTNVIQ